MPQNPKPRYFKLKSQFVEKGAAILVILTDKATRVHTDGKRSYIYQRIGETAEDAFWDFRRFYDEIPAAEAALIS